MNNFLFNFLDILILNNVPFDLPSQNAIVLSQFVIIFSFLTGSALLPYLSHSGKKIIISILCSSAYFSASLSAPIEPPDTMYSIFLILSNVFSNNE